MRLLAREICDAHTDILVTNAQYAEPYVYYLTALRPAPLIVGLNHGHPHAYTSHLLDWAICWTKHSLMDSLSNASLVKGGLDLASSDDARRSSREEFGLPAGALVLISTGRPHKFQYQGFWRAVADILQAHKDT